MLLPRFFEYVWVPLATNQHRALCVVLSGALLRGAGGWDGQTLQMNYRGMASRDPQQCLRSPSLSIYQCLLRRFLADFRRWNGLQVPIVGHHSPLTQTACPELGFLLECLVIPQKGHRWGLYFVWGLWKLASSRNCCISCGLSRRFFKVMLP